MDVTCCDRLHTLLHVVACSWELLRKSLKPVTRLATCKRTQQPQTLLAHWELLRPFARGLRDSWLY